MRIRHFTVESSRVQQEGKRSSKHAFVCVWEKTSVNTLNDEKSRAQHASLVKQGFTTRRAHSARFAGQRTGEGWYWGGIWAKIVLMRYRSQVSAIPWVLIKDFHASGLLVGLVVVLLGMGHVAENYHF